MPRLAETRLMRSAAEARDGIAGTFHNSSAGRKGRHYRDARENSDCGVAATDHDQA